MAAKQPVRKMARDKEKAASNTSFYYFPLVTFRKEDMWPFTVFHHYPCNRPRTVPICRCCPFLIHVLPMCVGSMGCDQEGTGPTSHKMGQFLWVDLQLWTGVDGNSHPCIKATPQVRVHVSKGPHILNHCILYNTVLIPVYIFLLCRLKINQVKGTWMCCE
jgi:hypothetical protein